MDFQQRKGVLVQLGQLARAFAANKGWPGYEVGITREEYDSFAGLIAAVHVHNGWFTEDNVIKALQAWGVALEPGNIDQWVSAYEKANFEGNGIEVGIIAAGNIPFVALHDVLAVFLCGHRSVIKLSKDDQHLMPELFRILGGIFEELPSLIRFTDGRLDKPGAVIATGSNNSARYFNYYFRDVPHIIRKNRNSIALITGDETRDELSRLGHDIFDYFGLGCRNVTKLFVPRGYDFATFFEALYAFHPVIHHNKYANNYDYNKAVWLLNKEKLLDNNFLLLKEDQRTASPTASLFYEYYDDASVLKGYLMEYANDIQCVTGRGYLPFGSTQCPMLWDYADGVDTMDFLLDLKEVQK